LIDFFRVLIGKNTDTRQVPEIMPLATPIFVVGSGKISMKQKLWHTPHAVNGKSEMKKTPSLISSLLFTDTAPFNLSVQRAL
jgi:hypothetical protein